MAELTSEEIASIKSKLYDPERRDRLNRVQKEMMVIFRNWRNQEGRKYVRILSPREDIKALDSVLAKIDKKRREGNPRFAFEDIDDLIGTKILCPYPTDVKVVINWLFSPNQIFSVEPPEEKAKDERDNRDRERGYRAYHFYLQLRKDYVIKNRLPSGSEREKFEVQIKTLLDEAWDAKTHDITYKREDVKQELQNHMKLVSRSLAVLDEQTELLKDEILEEETEEGKRKEVAKVALLTGGIPEQERVKLGFPKGKQIEELSEDEIQEIEKKVSEEGVNALACHALPLIALVTNSVYHKDTAIYYANKLVEQCGANTDKLVDSLGIRAFIQWVLGHTRQALEDVSKAINHGNRISHKADYIYYVWELRNATDQEKGMSKNYVKEIEQLIKQQPEKIPPHVKDSVGYFYIKSGENIETIEQGRKYIREASEEEKNSQYNHVAQAFYELHDYIATKRMLKLYEHKPPA